MLPSKPSRLIGPMQIGMLTSALAGVALVFYGHRQAPGASLLSFAAAAAAFFVYSLIGLFVIPAVNRINHQIPRLVCVFGLCGAAIFTGEMLLEYLLLPADNSFYGLVEYGCVYLLYFSAAAAAAYQSQQVKQGVLAALVSALISSLIWAVAVLLIFYLFQGTSRQTQVFRAEGNYADFAQGGSRDFRIWVTEDFMGAIFFHLTLVGPLVSAVLGVLGGLLGKSAAGIVKSKARKATA